MCHFFMISLGLSRHSLLKTVLVFASLNFLNVNCYAILSCGAVYYVVQGSFDSNTKSLASIFPITLCPALFGGGGGGHEGGQEQV